MSQTNQARRVPGALRYISVALGIVLMIFATGFAFDMPWATATWPWPDSPLSYLFVGSILAAVSVALIWIGLTEEWGALPAGAITVLVMSAGMLFYVVQLSGQPHRQGMIPFIVWFAFVVVSCAVLFFWSRRFPILDMRPTPLLVRVSYVIFFVVLVLTASALILRVPAIFPWSLDPDSSVMFGCIFLGDACYFLYAALHSRWHDARSELLSFLAYDVFLIPPFLALFATVQPDHLLSLTIYMIVLIYSFVLAIYYLLIDRRTRGWSVQRAEQTEASTSNPGNWRGPSASGIQPGK